MSPRESRQTLVSPAPLMAAMLAACVSLGTASEPAPSKRPNAVQLDAGGLLRIRKPVKTFKDFKLQRAVLQRYDYSCGAAALATILQHYYGLPVNEQSVVAYLLQVHGTETALLRYKEKKGFSLLDLKQAAASAGFECVAFAEMTLADLVDLNAPAIIPIRVRGFDHFVIFRGIRDDRVFLTDPVAGNITMKGSQLLGAWNGGIGMTLRARNGTQPRYWQPDRKNEGRYVSQDLTRSLLHRRDALAIVKGPREF